jgi:hypothetical protein
MQVCEILDENCEEISRINNLTLDDVMYLKNDNCAYIDDNNHIYFECQCDSDVNVEMITFDDTYNDFPDDLEFPENNTFLLHSRPGSVNKIYLDFRGGTLINSYWNTLWGTPITYSAYSPPSPNNTSTAIASRIQTIWKGVAEDFAPFDVDVTTEPINYNARCIITNNSSIDVSNNNRGSAGGIAFVNVWNQPLYYDCWCFSAGTGTIKAIITIISHEVGHILNLFHQGTNVDQYYSGSGLGAGSWGPIMGAPYNMSITEWAYVPIGQTYTGTSVQPSRNQDDLAIINVKLPYASDDYPNSVATAANTTAISSSSSITTYYGTIEKTTDIDVFKLKTGLGIVTITGIVSTTQPNLNLQLTLYDSNNNIIATGTKTNVNDLNSVIIYQVPSNGLFYVSVDGIGSTYYTDYGSLGKYKITFSLQPISITAIFTPPDGNLGTIAVGNNYSLLGNIGLTTDTGIISAWGFNGQPTDPNINLNLSLTTDTAATYSFSNTSTMPGLNDFSLYTGIQIPTIDNDIYYKYSGKYTYRSILPCISTNSEILLKNGQYKLIQDIKRGDIVSSDPNFMKEYCVARVNKMKLDENAIINMYEFQPNSLNNNVPYKNLLITKDHPIIHQKTCTRRPAYAFKNYPNINIFTNIKAGNILPKIDDELYDNCLWDLQFEEVGTYVANGVTLQSRNPRSRLSPLPKELYFNESLYTNALMNDHDPANEYPFVCTQLII